MADDVMTEQIGDWQVDQVALVEGGWEVAVRVALVPGQAPDEMTDEDREALRQCVRVTILAIREHLQRRNGREEEAPVVASQQAGAGPWTLEETPFPTTGV